MLPAPAVRARIAAALLGALAALTLPAPAPGQVPAAATFGGGAIAGPGKTLGRPGDREVALRTSADGTKARVRAVSVVRCGRRLAEVSGMRTVAVAADGTFARRMRVRAGRFTHRIDIAGTIAGQRATGTMTAAVLRRGRRVCGRTGRWRAIVPPEFPSEGDDTSPTWAGVVRQRGAAEPLGVMVRTLDSPELARVVIGMQIRCRRAASYYVTHYTSPADYSIGEFEVTDRFVLRTARTVERVSTKLTAFAVSVGFTGTVRSTSVVRSRRTGRVVDRCGTGRVTWAAAP